MLVTFLIAFLTISGTPFLQAKTAFLRLANEHSELKASLGDLTVKYKELAQRVNSMESNGHHPTYRNDLIDGHKMIEILPGSKILVSAWQLEKAKKKQKVSLFAARMFTVLEAGRFKMPASPEVSGRRLPEKLLERRVFPRKGVLFF